MTVSAFAPQRISTCLWFDDQAEEAVNSYVGLFEDSRILDVARHGDAGPGPEGSVLSVTFQLEGRQFVALNGGPNFKSTEAQSMYVRCDDQAEVDRLWSALSADGGTPGNGGRLKDRYGLSWQIIPSALERLLADPDPARAKRAKAAMQKMDKIDIAAIEKAAGEGQS
ncbi:MAG: VOC family protein [Burkholderiaceae bacterium]|jgi:predicted 3-demethylubiquinone-9 3-methyltransferase (glyoxalase superfamily)